MTTLDVIDFYWGIDEEFELNDHLDNVNLTAQCKQVALAHDARPGTYGAIYAGHEEEEAYAHVFDSDTDEAV